MKAGGPAFVPVIRVDRSSKDALHHQIYGAFRRAVDDGTLRPGQRVPSTRFLASELGVSRFPVLTAYAQLLAEGYFEGKVGSGTIVGQYARELLPEETQTNKKKYAEEEIRRRKPRSVPVPTSAPRPTWVRGTGAFGVGQIACDQFPVKTWTNLAMQCSRKMSSDSLNYGDSMGSLALRGAVAEYLRTSRAVKCEAEQIIMVGGSQQGLDICVRVLLEVGSAVWVEEPGYGLGRAAITLGGCRIIPVPVDGEGLQVSEGIARANKAAAVLITPSHQFPLGVTMSSARRIQLLEWARESGAWVIEDDYDSEFRFDGPPIPSLQGIDRAERVIYIGTFSKVLFPSIRMGYVVVPPDLVNRFETVRRIMDISPPRFSQDLLAAFMEQGHFARHIRKMRVIYRERREMLANTLERNLGSQLEVIGNEAGLHLTAFLRTRADDLSIAMQAARHQLWLWPLSTHYLGPPQKAGFVLGFGSSTPDDISMAVGKLERLLSTRQHGEMNGIQLKRVVMK